MAYIYNISRYVWERVVLWRTEIPETAILDMCCLYGGFFIEFFLSHDKRHYLATHFIFFIVSIPYQAILYHFGWNISKDVAYLVRYMPLIRGGYAMAIVVSWFTYNKATGLSLLISSRCSRLCILRVWPFIFSNSRSIRMWNAIRMRYGGRRWMSLPSDQI